jgi:hypothetical protein
VIDPLHTSINTGYSLCPCTESSDPTAVENEAGLISVRVLAPKSSARDQAALGREKFRKFHADRTDAKGAANTEDSGYC